MEKSNLPEKEFRVMIIKIKERRRRMDAQNEKSEVFTKKTKNKRQLYL